MDLNQTRTFPLVMHPDQTTKQPVVWVCFNPDCAPPKRRDFVFQSDYPVCPKCKNSGFPYIQKRVLIHLLIPDPMGAIQGQYRRYRMACDKTRELLATPTNGEACTNNPNIVNCPGCEAANLAAAAGGISITAENIDTLLVKPNGD